MLSVLSQRKNYKSTNWWRKLFALAHIYNTLITMPVFSVCVKEKERESMKERKQKYRHTGAHSSRYFGISFELHLQDSCRYQHERVSSPVTQCEMQQQCKRITCSLPHVAFICGEGPITLLFICYQIIENENKCFISRS